MKILNFIKLLPLFILLSACTGKYSPMNSKYVTLDNYIEQNNLIPINGFDLTVCSGYNCNFITNIKFTDQDRREIINLFPSGLRTAKQERDMISKAIGKMEQITGLIVGTNVDKGGVLENEYIGDITRQDCVDESSTTTNYLKYLVDLELIYYHNIEIPQSRGALIDGRWPHFTAVVRDKKTSEQFAIDSWYLDNGETPIIMPLKDWVFDWTKSSEIKSKFMAINSL
jgi:hypothetical protein